MENCEITFRKRQKNDDIPPLLLNGQLINYPYDKANVFSHYFHSLTQLDDSGVPVQNFLNLIPFFFQVNLL